MQISYDAQVDALRIAFKEKMSVDVSDEVQDDFVLDYDEQGNIIGIEILNASTRIDHPLQMHFTVTGVNDDASA